MTHRLSRLACVAALTATTVGLALDAGPASAVTRTVNTTADVVDAADQFLSLREAVNLSTFNDTIVIPAGTYILQCPTGPENANASGDLDILRGITMSGPTDGTAVITINPSCGERVIHVLAGSFAPMVFENLTISGGRESSNFGAGGGLLVGGAATTIRNSIIEDNQAGPNGDGGGVRSTTALTIENTDFFDNHAGDADGNNPGGDGGAIAMSTGGSPAPLTITDSTIGSVARPNTSGDGAGTGSAGSGGAIYADTKSDLTITRTTIDGNRLGVAGSGVAGGDAAGGGVATRSFTAEAGVATITDSIISANQGGNGLLGGGGGAWLANLDVTITGTTISNNTVPASTQGTRAGHGGGVAITTEPLIDPIDVTMSGNTITGNTIATPGVGTGAVGPGGGNGGGVYIDADSGTVELIDNVFDGNTAGDNNIGSTASAAPAGGGGNVYVSLLTTSASPIPGSITIRSGAIRNGRSGGGTASTAGWGGGAHLVAGTQAAGGTIVIDDVDVTGNATKNTTAGGVGGGLYALSSSSSGTAGSITIDAVTASDNQTAGGRTGAGNSGGDGGALYLEARGTTTGAAITIRDSNFDGNSTGSGTAASSGLGGAGGDGGAIYAWAEQVLVDGSTFTDNGTGNGATGTTNGGRGGDGGALSTMDAAVTMTATTFTDNATGNGGTGTTTNGGASGHGGGWFARDAGTISVSDSTFSGNATGDGGSGQASGGRSGDGGGAAIDVSTTDAAVSITSSAFTNNAIGAGAPGGTNHSGIGGNGGGVSIDVDGGDVTLDAVRFTGNQAGAGAGNTTSSGADARGGFGGDGGGISIIDSERRSEVSVLNSTFSDNLAGDAGSSASSDAGLAGDGGGIFVSAAGFSPDPAGTAAFSLERSTLAGNDGGAGASGAGASTPGGAGGGAYVRVGAGLDVERSTIHGNSGGAPGTGTSPGDGGGMFVADGASSATFEHVTMTANDGLNGVNLLTRATTNSFLSTAIGDKADRDFENCNAIGVTVTSNGYNVEGSEGGFTCGFDSDDDLEVEGLELGPLASNGGATQTRLPIFDSPLIDLRPCTATTDQRGVAAPSGAGCDTGAAEVEFDDVIVTTDPARFADTRAIGDTIDGRFEADGRRNAGAEYEVQIAGRGDIPDDAVGAILNVTAVGATSNGYVTVHPCLPEPPLASSLNHTAGVNIGNEIIAGLDGDGAACFFTFASIHLTVDVVGYVPAASPYVPIAPARILETRDQPGATTIDGLFQGAGKTSASGESVQLDIRGRAGVPDDAAAAVINVTAVRAEEQGFITVFPCGPNLPVAASLNYTAGVNRGNELIAQLGDRPLCLFTPRAIHITVDVVGYIPAGSDIIPVLPQRLVDTRDTVKPTPGSELRVQVTGPANRAPGVPEGARAAIVNVTAVRPDQRGFVTVHPCLPEPPLASSLNYVAGVNGGNELIARLSASGELCLFTNQSTHFTVDIVGYLL